MKTLFTCVESVFCCAKLSDIALQIDITNPLNDFDFA